MRAAVQDVKASNGVDCLRRWNLLPNQRSRAGTPKKRAARRAGRRQRAVGWSLHQARIASLSAVCAKFPEEV